jgi:hypothetical protein
MKNLFKIMVIIIVIGLSTAQAQELTWVVSNFTNSTLGIDGWLNWWGAITFARVQDLPATGDKTLQVTVTGADNTPARDYSLNGQDISSNPAIAHSVTIDVWFPADFPTTNRVTLVDQPQGGSWPWFEADQTINKGGWTTLVFNVDSMAAINSDFANQKSRFSIRVYMVDTSYKSCTFYIDNVTLHGVRKPIGTLESPALTVANTNFKTVNRQTRYANRIKWTDLPVDISESYNIYASKTGAITNVSAPGVVKLASGISRKQLVFNHWLYSNNGASQTWYYAMTTSATDTLGSPVETPVITQSQGSATGPSTIPYIIPYLTGGFTTFALDGAVDEFEALATTYTGMLIQPEYMFGNHTGTTYTTDAEVPVDTSKFNFKMYMVMDNSYLYVAQSVKDVDHIGVALQVWQGESADIFWSSYDADTVTSWPSSMDAARGDHRFGCLWGAEGDARWPTSGGANNSMGAVPQIETFVDTLEGVAMWEMKIPLANVGPSGFTPHDGMFMPWCLWENTVNDTRDGRGSVLIVGCADNNTDGLGQEDKILAVNPNRWERPITWGRIMLSSTNVAQQTDVAKGDQIPFEYNLDQNYPNPFNPSTKINFTLAKVSDVKLSVFNVLGQKVATLVDTRMSAGPQSVVFDASKLASGVYFYRLDAGTFSSIKKMMLLK